MSSETPGGGVTTPTSGENVSVSAVPNMTLGRQISDEITIYEITAPIPSKPTLKPLSFEVTHEPYFKTTPLRMSPQKLSPLSGAGNQKILSPSHFSILSPMRESQSPCDQLPQFVPSPSSHHVLLIPSKPELTVTVVNSPTQSETLMQVNPPTSGSSPVPPVLPVTHSNPIEHPKLELDLENAISCSKVEMTMEEEKSTVRSKRQRRVFMPHQQKTMYRTRTMVKASLAAQHEKDELASQKTRNEVPSVKPTARVLDLTLPPPTLTSRGGRKRSQRKLSTAEQLQQLREDHSLDLENPGSILKLINLKNVLTRHNFSRLPLDDQFRLLQLLPDVDIVSETGNPDHFVPSEDAFDNLFYNKACEDWKAKLIAGDFTPEHKQKLKQEEERDKAKVDPWKKKHFEPIWGFNDVKRILTRTKIEAKPSSTITKVEIVTASPQLPPSPIPEQEENESPVTITLAPELNEPKEVEPSPPAQIQPSPGKRDSAHLSEEPQTLSKRICLPLTSPSETQASFTEQDSVNSCSEMFEAEEEENELNKTPVPAVDNEITIENSPYESSSASSPLSPEVPEPIQHLVSSKEDEAKSEPAFIETVDFDKTSSLKKVEEEPQSVNEVHEDASVSDISDPATIPPSPMLLDTEVTDVKVEEATENSATDSQGEEQISQNSDLLVQTTSEDMEVQVTELQSSTETDMNARQNVESETSKEINFVTEECSATSASSLQAEEASVVVSFPSLISGPVSSVATTTTTIQVPISQEPLLSTDRASHPQPLILRMVSIAPPSSSTLTSSVRPPQVTAPLQPVALKPMGGIRVEPIRNIVPKVLTDFIPVQPRALIGIPEAGKVASASTGQHQSLSPLTKLNGPGVVGAIQSPGSPGNVSSLLCSKKISRHKPPRQAKPKPSTVPPGSVNLDRSYQICQAVIASSPNREQLQKQLVKPPPLTAPNIRGLRPDISTVGDGSNAVIQSSRRASTPTMMQGSMPMVSGVSPAGQKVMLVNHPAMTPLIRPIQQQTQPLNHHQIVVSSSSNSNGIGGQRVPGMNVTYTTKHNPATNNHPITSSSTPQNVITPQQLALLLQQQHTNQHLSRQSTLPSSSNMQSQQQRPPALYISRPQQSQQPPQLKILNCSQFSAQSRLVSPQILQFQQAQRSSLQLSQDAMQVPIRAQIKTANGETLTIHRAVAGGLQPMRVSSPIRSLQSMGVDHGKVGTSTSITQPVTIMNRTNVHEHRVQTIVTNSHSQVGDPPSASSQSSPAQNLADFITNQWTAASIRPISPLAFDSSGSDRLTLQGQGRTSATPPNKPLESLHPHHHNSSSPSAPQNSIPSHSHQLNQSEYFVTNHQKPHSSSNHHHQLGMAELVSQGTLLDVQDGNGNNGEMFQLIKQQKNTGSPLEFIQMNRGMIERIAPPPTQHPNSPNGHDPTNHNFSRAVVDGGGSLVQNPVDGQGGDGLQQHYVIVQTTGSNGMPQNLVLQASLLIPQQVKEEGKCGDGGPPRAASAPPTNPGIVIGQHQVQNNCIVQENKHIPLPVNYQDFSGLRVIYKDESAGNEDVRRMEYCLPNTTSSYTVTPVSSAGNQDVVRVVSRTSTGSPDVWNYRSVPPSGHIVNVNLNGSSGSARIIPGQHPVISIPDTTNGSSSCSGVSSDFDLFSAIASKGNENIKIENNGETRSILIPVSMTNNNRQNFNTVSVIGQHGGQGLPSNQGNCVCDLRAMTACRKCGAYSHSDCMKNGMELCMGCVIR